MNAPIIPIPRSPVTVRVATAADLPFIDSLQKLHSKQVGWMPTKSLEQKIGLGHVLLAEDESKRPAGYCTGQDQYFKRDDVGIIYQLNVVPGRQRSFVGATLLKAMFERAAYGCKLFCCWCAQDIEANRFWESMGFVPLAFRAGSAAKARVHIFWQKRVRSGDRDTPWWFPSQTSAGSIREDRLVLPLPPGTHWSDAKPIILPGAESPAADSKRLPAGRQSKQSEKPNPPRKRPAITATSGLRFGFANDAVPVKNRETKPREPKRKVKNDPRLVAAARELRDRWLERVNADPSALLAEGKYDVARMIGEPVHIHAEPMKLLPAA